MDDPLFMSYLPFSLRPVPSGQGPRPPMFVLLCTLSFIGSGISAFMYLIMALNFEEMSRMMEDSEFAVPNLSLFLTGGAPFFMLESILNAVAFAGVLYMWNRKITGFHLYTAAQLFLAMVPIAFLEGHPFMVTDAIISGLFVLLYYLQMKRFGFGDQGEETKSS